MKFAKASATLGLIALALLASVPAAAADLDSPDSPWYIGVNMGQSHAHIDNVRIAGGLQQAGFTIRSIYDDETDVGIKLFGGYQFNRYLALEANYFDLGKSGFYATTSPPESLKAIVGFQGLSLDPVLSMPITERFSTFLRAGVTYVETETRYMARGSVSAPPDRTKRAANYKYGAGFEYVLTGRPLTLRVEAEQYRLDDAVGNVGDVQFISFGLIYRFAKNNWTRPVARAAPAPVLIVVPVPPVLAVRTQKYCSILDIEFEINLNEIQREEKERLEVVGTFLKKYPESTAVIEGHTDDIGSDEDNMTLSQRRAESVVAYLVDTFHIAPARLQAVGYGETHPIADNDTEEGKRQNRRIGAVIACANDIAGLTVKPARITVALEMEFDLNETGVRTQYHDQLGQVASFLKANPAVTATVEGHTANLQGSADEGMQLSSRRAQSVVDYLVENFDVPRARLAAEGFGQTRRFAYNTSTEGQQENRRVNIILNYPRSSSTIGAN